MTEILFLATDARRRDRPGTEVPPPQRFALLRAPVRPAACGGVSPLRLRQRVCPAPSSDADVEGAVQPFCLVLVTYQARWAGAPYGLVISRGRV